jgi:stage III sporulation protein AA
MYQDEILPLLPERLQTMIRKADKREQLLQEIRLRRRKPLALQYGGEVFVPEPAGQVVTDSEFKEVLSRVSQYSLYAFEEEIKKGYLTIPGGHRIGLLGRAVLEGEKVKTMRHISFLNIRISREVVGCADDLLPYVLEGDRFCSTLLVSPPGGGKTTLLRDLVRQLAGGNSVVRGRNVSVVDERSEIAGCYQGVAQKQLGDYCDVVDACPKALGMRMVIRSMAPEVVAVDEVGGSEDCEAMRYALTSGCSLLATAHGESLEHMREKPLLRDMLREEMFERYVFLNDRKNPGRWHKICDGRGRVLWG